MKNIRIFSSENFQFWVVKVSIYLNRRVFVMNGMEIVRCNILNAYRCYHQNVKTLLLLLLLLFRTK